MNTSLGSKGCKFLTGTFLHGFAGVGRQPLSELLFARIASAHFFGFSLFCLLLNSEFSASKRLWLVSEHRAVIGLDFFVHLR